MASSANTFGTFLETIKKLEEARPATSTHEDEVLIIAKMLAGTGGEAPLRDAMTRSGVQESAFFRAVFAGREKGIFEIDETPAQPLLRLTKLGRGFAG